MVKKMIESKIYIASKTKHAKRWRKFRDEGINIISSWIDEACQGESKSLQDLWIRNINEAKSADFLIMYNEPNEIPKGSLIELGAALANNIPIYWIGPTYTTVGEHSEIKFFTNFEEVFNEIKEIDSLKEAQFLKEIIFQLEKK
jgi:hypothetical protein